MVVLPARVLEGEVPGIATEGDVDGLAEALLPDLGVGLTGRPPAVGGL